MTDTSPTVKLPQCHFFCIVCTRLSNSDDTEMVLPGKRACLVLKARSAQAHLTRSLDSSQIGWKRLYVVETHAGK